MEPAVESPRLLSVTVKSRSGTSWLSRQQIRLLALVAACAASLVLLSWGLDVYRHRAMTYGITDPSCAALRIDNRANGFTVTLVSIGNAEANVTRQDVYQEIGPGARAVVEIEPGSYVVAVSYMEIKQATVRAPKGLLNESFSVAPGEAAILSFQGGRTSPERFILFPPELAFR